MKSFRKPVKMKKFLKENPEILFGYVKNQFVQMERNEKNVSFSIKITLTEKQRIVYDAAKEWGYFDYPRKINLKDLSKKMGMINSTLTVHMQKVIEKIIKQAEITE